MSDEPRKASDVLLSLENKIDSLTTLVKLQEHLIKVLSNKINDLALKINGQTIHSAENKPNFTIEAAEAPQVKNKLISIKSEDMIPEENNPIGARRNSRPETHQNSNKLMEQKFPTQIIKPSGQVEFIPQNKTPPVSFNLNDKSTETTISNSKIPVSQRVVDKNGKAVFLAEVEIINQKTKEIVSKTRTNGAGKWSAPLEPGSYKAIIKKREGISGNKIEMPQEIIIDGKTSPIEINNLIFK